MADRFNDWLFLRGWTFLDWKIRIRGLWTDRKEIVAEKIARLKCERVLAVRAIECSDGPDGSAGQTHALLVGCGLFGWKDTGIETHWRRLGRDGAETRTFHFDDQEFDTEKDALAAYDAANKGAPL